VKPRINSIEAPAGASTNVVLPSELHSTGLDHIALPLPAEQARQAEKTQDPPGEAVVAIMAVCGRSLIGRLSDGRECNTGEHQSAHDSAGPENFPVVSHSTTPFIPRPHGDAGWNRTTLRIRLTRIGVRIDNDPTRSSLCYVSPEGLLPQRLRDARLS
jgi:hypothetical protein